jgi:hypothetical protein
MASQLLSSKKQPFTPRELLVSTPVEEKSFLKLYPKNNIFRPITEKNTKTPINN